MSRPATYRRRLTTTVVVLALLSAACAAGGEGSFGSDVDRAQVPVPEATVTPSPTPSTQDGAIQDTLDRAAEAFLAADPSRLRPLLTDPERPFGQRWLDRASWLAEVPLTSYTLTLDPSLPDLATASVRQRFTDPVQVRYVREEHRLQDVDPAGPDAEDLFLTLVERDGAWTVADDTDAEPLGLVSADHLWDHGPVVVTRDGPLLALHHPGSPNVPTVLGEARAALRDVAARWPLDWPQQVPIVVPRDQDELAELLHVTFELDNFVAFATASPVGELGAYRLTGARVLINPDRFLNRSSGTRRSILAHELLHVATRAVAGPMIPAWVEEGLAQRLGEQRSTTGLALLERLVGQAGFVGALPDDSEFTTGGRDRIFLSYQLAYSFVDHLTDTYGADAVARFYEELGRGAVGAPGRESWHVERAAQEVFGRSLDELRDAWVQALRAGG